MFTTADQRPEGPEFLRRFAQQSLAQGLTLNAAEFRVRAAEWQQDRATIAQQAATIAALQEDLRRVRHAADRVAA